MAARALGLPLELYYVDGGPDGLILAKTFNWTGQLMVMPRTRLTEGLARPEANRAGVYLLLGEQAGKPLAYVGESEDLAARIRNHDQKKDWWTSAVLISGAAAQLNKAHVRYLEARLVAEAKAVGITPLENGTTPSLPALSEADQANMETFLASLLLLLPAVRIDLFVQRTRPALAKIATATEAALSPEARFTLEALKYGLSATAVLVDGEFVVQAGSTARATWVGAPSEVTSYANLYAELLRAGVIIPEGDRCVFTQNCVLKSASAAASVVWGHPTNGLTAWKTAAGQTYREWEKQRLAAPAS